MQNTEITFIADGLAGVRQDIIEAVDSILEINKAFLEVCDTSAATFRELDPAEVRKYAERFTDRITDMQLNVCAGLERLVGMIRRFGAQGNE